MLSFKSEVNHSRIRFILGHTLWLIAGVCTLMLFNYYTRPGSQTTSFTVFGLLFIRGFVFSSFRFYMRQIDIDEEKRKITFNCFQFWRGRTTFKESFDEVKMDITTRGWFSKTPTIYFFKYKVGEFYVSRVKDRFASKTLIELSDTLEKLTSFVKRKRSPRI